MARTVIFDEVDPEPWKGALTPGIAALTVEWNAVQAATLTPDQQRAVNRGAHLAVFGTEPPAGEPIDFRKAFPGGVIVL
ncbi:hypothetical protein AFCDBAGC_1049 [Methylobacterium cerastii]|uniref:Uncharacterized protein n=1 Tax=Methylobacterium cerastii TaxID=932741 RepID=A0ABQ4QDL1_9HYPH|nr:hypothetical protein [Methylobacterium cerastii]GJD43202.1 hypothetical protein AFCDBAGC_1049 [Methylobacterium cerastii]